MTIPKGYRLVPVEPTDEMLTALIDTWFSASQVYDKEAMSQAYKAMLAAAPQPTFDEAAERELFEAWSAEHYYLGGCAVLIEDGEYKDTDMQYSWESWLACAQSRAKAGEVGHE